MIMINIIVFMLFIMHIDQFIELAPILIVAAVFGLIIYAIKFIYICHTAYDNII